MKISVESKDLISIADDIQHNCTMLSFTDEEDAEDDVAYYVPVIQQLADDLKDYVECKEQEAQREGVS